MSHKCNGCIFEGEWRNMGSTTTLCDRYVDLERALKEHSKPGPCQYHITQREIIRLQNAGILKGDSNV